MILNYKHILSRSFEVRHSEMVWVTCDPGQMCPRSHLSRVRCVPGHMCPGSDVSRVRCVPGHMCPGSDVSRVRCVPGHTEGRSSHDFLWTTRRSHNNRLNGLHTVWFPNASLEYKWQLWALDVSSRCLWCSCLFRISIELVTTTSSDSLTSTGFWEKCSKL